MNPNAHTEWSGEGEASIQSFRKPISPNGIVDPNQFNQWQPEHEKNAPGTKVERAIDRIMSEQEIRKCPKCSFSTASQEAYRLHTEDVDGMTRCERERKRFSDDEKNGSKIDPKALASAVAEEVAKAIQPGFMMLAEALKGLTQPRLETPPSVQQKPKEKRHVRAPGMVRGGTGAVEPFVVGEMEQPDQPVADPLPESEETL